MLLSCFRKRMSGQARAEEEEERGFVIDPP